MDYELPLRSGKNANEMTWPRVKSEAYGPKIDVSAVEGAAQDAGAAVSDRSAEEEQRRIDAAAKIQALTRGRMTRDMVPRKPGMGTMEGWLHKKSTRGQCWARAGLRRVMCAVAVSCGYCVCFVLLTCSFACCCLSPHHQAGATTGQFWARAGAGHASVLGMRRPAPRNARCRSVVWSPSSPWSF